VSAGHRPAAAAGAGIAHMASGCLTVAIAVAIAYTGFFPVDNGADAFLSQLKFGRPGGAPLPFPDWLISGPVFLVASLVVAIGMIALGVVEVRIGRRALRGTGYFAVLTFGIAWSVVSLLLANYPGFLLAGVAAVSAWWAREWYRDTDLAAENGRWTTPHHLKDWTLPDAPAAPAPPASDPGEPGLRPD
jgi:MFS family permease